MFVLLLFLLNYTSCRGQDILLCETDISTLQENMENVFHKLEESEKHLLETNQIIREQQQEIDALKKEHDNEMENMHGIIRDLVENQQKIAIQLNVLEDESKQKATTITSSFTAYPYTSHSYNTGDILIFDRTLINLGNNYLDNCYTAPTNGLYLIAMSLTSSAGYRMEAIMVKNGQPLVEVINYDTSTHHSASNVVLVELTNGDAVWVQALNDGNWLESGTISTFSGILLQEYSESH